VSSGRYLNAAMAGRSNVPKLSIVITSLSAHEALEQSLVSVLSYRPDECEVLVVCGDHYPDPYEIDDEVTFLEAPSGASLAECVNLGIRHSRAPLIHVLAAGVEVTEDWVHDALWRFDDPLVAAVAPMIFEENLDDSRPWRVHSAGITYKAGGSRVDRAAGLEPQRAEALKRPLRGASLAGAFFRKEAIQRVAPGFDSVVGDALCDIDLALRLEHAGYRAELAPGSQLIAGDAHVSHSGSIREGLRRERMFLRNAPITGWPKAIVTHGFTLLADLFRKGGLLRLLGRTIGWIECPRHVAHYRRLGLQQDTALASASSEPASLSLDTAVAERSSRHAADESYVRHREAA
jgi:GT2 family glycosyltransferase